MKITSLNLPRNNDYKQSLPKAKQQTNYSQDKNSFVLYSMNYYVSFGAKTPLELIKEIGLKNFPSPKIFQKVTEGYKNDCKFSLYGVHIENYKDLLECKTLEEAKKLFPEFTNVIDAKTVKYSDMSQHMKRIKNEKSDIKIEDLSLDLLKKYFGKAIPINNKEEYHGMSVNTVKRMLESLNFPIYNPTYSRVLYHQSPERIQAAAQKTSEFARLHPEWSKAHSEFMREYTNRPEIKQKLYAQHVDESVKQRISQKVKEYNRQNPENVKRHAQYLFQYYKNNPQARQKISAKMSDFRRQHPEYGILKSYVYTKLFPDYCENMSKIAEEFPALASIRAKFDRGIKLTEGEIAYERKYFSRCNEELSDMNAQIGAVYKELIDMFKLSKNGNSQQKIQEINDVFKDAQKVQDLMLRFRGNIL